MKKSNFWVNLSVWYEADTKFGYGLYKDYDTSNYYSEILKRYNPINSINEKELKQFSNNCFSLAIVKRLTGVYDFIQLSGYTEEKGSICYYVHDDGSIEKAF